MPDDSLIRGTRVGPSPNTVYRSSSDAIVVDTTAETEILVYTVPAFTLDGDHSIKAFLDVEYAKLDAAGITNAIFRAYYGATEMWEWTQGMVNPLVFPARIELELAAKNSDAAQEMFVQSNLNGSAKSFYDEATEDATTDLDFRVTVEIAAADPDIYVLLRRAVVQQL